MYTRPAAFLMVLKSSSCLLSEQTERSPGSVNMELGGCQRLSQGSVPSRRCWLCGRMLREEGQGSLPSVGPLEREASPVFYHLSNQLLLGGHGCDLQEVSPGPSWWRLSVRPAAPSWATSLLDEKAGGAHGATPRLAPLQVEAQEESVCHAR